MQGIWKSTLSLLSGRTDEQAMWRVKTHDDQQEFARLVRRWEGPIHRLCSRMTGDPERGEELKQEAFLRVYQRRKSYEAVGKFSTYIWRIALNLCFDELRRQQRRREFLKTDDIATSTPGESGDGNWEEVCSEYPGPDRCAAQSEEGELIRRAVLQLPEIYRVVIVLRHYENMKLARIAEVLDIPVGTVNSRMAEALSRLNRALAPAFKEPQVRPALPDPNLQLKESITL